MRRLGKWRPHRFLTKLAGLETTVARVDKSLAALLRRFDELHVKMNDQHRGRGQEDDDGAENSGADYAADTEVEDQAQRCLRRNRRGMGGQRPHEVHNNDIAFSKIKFKILFFMVNMIRMLILLRR